MGSHQELFVSALGISADSSVAQYGIPIAALVALLPLTVLAYNRMTRNDNKPPTTSNHKTKQKKEESSSFNKSTMAPAPTNDVWAERRRRGIASASTSKKEDASEEKPFGSKYYYAHNNTNSKGGYTDGLRMEDFTMNGPRLLSKSVNGVPVVEEKQNLIDDTDNAITNSGASEQQNDEKPTASPIVEESTTETKPTKTQNLTPTKKRSLKITKFQWDDPGDANGIGTIRIDSLPGPSSKETLPWKDAKIQTVSATLEGEGLVVIATDENEQEYRLHIPKLYDRATEVRTVVKAKRLLVKIKKKRNGINFSGKSNLEAWPQPQKISYNL